MVKRLNERAWSESSSSTITLGQLAFITAINEKIRIYDKSSEDMIADGEYLKDVLLERPELKNVEILYLNATGSKTLWVEIRL